MPPPPHGVSDATDGGGGDGEFTLVTRARGGGRRGAAAAPPLPRAGHLDSLAGGCKLPDAGRHHPGLTLGGADSAAATAATGPVPLTSRRARREARVAGALAPALPQERLLRRLADAVARLEASAVAQSLRDGLDAFLDDAATATPGAREVDVVCYGLGSLRYGANPLQQLATLEVLRRTAVRAVVARHGSSAAVAAVATPPPAGGGSDDAGLGLAAAALSLGDDRTAAADPVPAAAVSVSLFDPLFDATDAAVLAALGYRVIGENEEAWRPVRRVAPQLPAATAATESACVPTVFFMPHCGREHNGAVLAANWGHALGAVCYVGNSMAVYRTAVTWRDAHGAPPVDGASERALAALRRWEDAADVAVAAGTGKAAPPAVTGAAADGAAASAADGRLVRVTEYPLRVPPGHEWEEARVALDVLAAHVFTWAPG